MGTRQPWRLRRLAGGWVVWPALLVGLAPAFADAGEKAASVRVIRDVPYYQGKDADRVRHRLDLYLPKGRKDFPVLLFIHGGAWRMGNKDNLAIPFSAMGETLGEAFARHGIGTVIINYRLAPRFKFPAQIEDVARAFAWTHKNIARYGGRPDALFVSGHSAGGQLAALLGTDETYMKAEGLSRKAIRGDIPISGVYRLTNDRFFEPAFGAGQAVRKKASPLNHVRKGDPPFLLLFAESDIPLCGKADAGAFAKALRDHHDRVETVEVKDRNHITILLSMPQASDPAFRAVTDFIHQYTPSRKRP